MIHRLFVLSVALLSLIACSNSSSSGTLTPQLKSTSTASTYNGISRRDPWSLTRWWTLGSGLRGTDWGGTTSDGLLSLKYFITSIRICRELTTSGTGYSDPTDCLEIYTGPTHAELNPAEGFTDTSADFSSLAVTARSTTTGYVDLMDETSRAALSSAVAVATTDAHEYNWGLVNWSYPIKVKAEVTTVGATSYVTHDGTVSKVGGGYQTVSTTAFSTGTAEEAVVVHNNGGTWFKFQNPFTISSADVSAGTGFELDLAFNPDNLLKLYPSSNAISNGSLYDGAVGSSNTFWVPMLDLTPIPRRSGEITIIETYVASSASFATGAGGAPSDLYDIRLQLFYNSADSEKSIYGALIRSITNSDSSGTETQRPTFPTVAFVAANADDSSKIDFNDYGGNPILYSFTRGTAVGDTSTLTRIACSGAYDTTTLLGTGCTGADSYFTATFTLDSIDSL